MNIADIITASVLCVLLVLSAVSYFKRRKKGGCAGCGKCGGCTACTANGNADETAEQSKNCEERKGGLKE